MAKQTFNSDQVPSGWVTAPAAYNSTGTAGQRAYDSLGNTYICYATNSWVKLSGSTRFPEYVFASLGDTNGMMYALGTAKGTTSFSNPVPGVVAVVDCPGTGSATNTVSILTDRLASEWVQTDVAGNYVLFDLSSSHYMAVKGYTVTHRTSSPTHALRSWKLQGSNNVSANTKAAADTATWVDVDVRSGDTTLQAAGQSAYFTCNQANTNNYRWWRLLQTGANSNGAQYLCLGELEFYGFLDV